MEGNVAPAQTRELFFRKVLKSATQRMLENKPILNRLFLASPTSYKDKEILVLMNSLNKFFM